MWSDIIRIFLTVVLSISFLFLFGGNNIKRYLEGGIGKISDEEFMKQENIPVPGYPFFTRLCTFDLDFASLKVVSIFS